MILKIENEKFEELVEVLDDLQKLLTDRIGI